MRSVYCPKCGPVPYLNAEQRILAWLEQGNVGSDATPQDIAEEVGLSVIRVQETLWNMADGGLLRVELGPRVPGGGKSRFRRYYFADPTCERGGEG